MKARTGLLIAATTVAGIYAAASATATAIAATITTSESTRHARLGEFEDSWRRASAEYGTARAKCEQLKRAKRYLCNAAARAEEKRSVLRGTRPPHEEATEKQVDEWQSRQKDFNPG